MKTKNFPKKKDNRRRSAVERMSEILFHGGRNEKGKKRTKKDHEAIIKTVINNTINNLVDNPRSIRTKVDRRGGGK